MELPLINLVIFSSIIICSTSDVLVTVLPGTERQNFTEGLFWDYVNQVLFYIDKDLFNIHRLNVVTGLDQQINLKRIISFVIPSRDHQQRFVINQEANVEYLFWPYDRDDGYYAECLIATVDNYYKGNTFNDARADKCGTVWSATYEKPDTSGNYTLNLASLYRLNMRKRGKADVTAVIRPISFGNDLTWNEDNTLFYFVESEEDCVYSFKYDLLRGLICDGQRVFCFSDFNITGRPDGMTIDSNGDLWVVANRAGMVINVNPNTKQLIRTVSIPAKLVQDVEFGGPDLDILYVATRNGNDPSEPLAGSIFQMTGLNVVGIRENYAVLNSSCTPEFFN